MSEPGLVVLDASVGVKWFKPETGQESAFALLEAVASGSMALAVPTHFAHEVLSVVARLDDPGAVVVAWDLMMDAGIYVVPLSDDVVREAARQCGSLGCTFYDALAPAVASLLGATLVSADSRAHGCYPGVEIIG